MGKGIRVTAGILSLLISIIVMAFLGLGLLMGLGFDAISSQQILLTIIGLISCFILLLSSIFVFLNQKWAKITNIILLIIIMIGLLILSIQGGIGIMLFLSIFFIITIILLIRDLNSAKVKSNQIN